MTQRNRTRVAQMHAAGASVGRIAKALNLTVVAVQYELSVLVK